MKKATIGGPRPKRNSTAEAAAIIVERDLSILTGEELALKYSTGYAAGVFRDITGHKAADLDTWNPFWHYLTRVWYSEPYLRGRLDTARHRDELAAAYLKLATGALDDYDGLHNQWPRRAFKSTFMAAFADWVPKRHKIVDKMDILVMYSHNSQQQATDRGETIKNLNRYNDYIATHFEGFRIPDGEWGTKEAWNWPSRRTGTAVVEASMTFLPALGKKAGRGYNYRLLDDWEDEDSMNSEPIRLDLAGRYQQLRKLKAMPFTREASCGTPYHIQSLYRPMLESKHEDGTPRYFIIKTPALTDDNVPLFPSIPNLSVKELAKERANEIKLRGNDRFWYLQYQLDPTLTGEQAMQWEWFSELKVSEWREKWSKVPHFKAVFCDPAWKGEEDQGRGCDAAIGMVAIFQRGEFYDYVLLEGVASNEMTSDEGAEEMCRMMKKWGTAYYAIEQSGDKPHVGMMRQVGRSQRPPVWPIYLDLKGWSKKSKAARISAVAGAARMGHWFYLEGMEERFRDALKVQVNEYPGCVKKDILDMMANAHADEVLRKWIPVSQTEGEASWDERKRRHIEYATRYTGLPAFVESGN